MGRLKSEFRQVRWGLFWLLIQAAQKVLPCGDVTLVLTKRKLSAEGTAPKRNPT